MHLAAHLLHDTGSHRDELGWTTRPKKAAIGIGAAFSGVLLFIRVKHDSFESKGDCDGANSFWERLPIILVLLVTVRFQDRVAVLVKQSATLGCRWATMTLRRSAISSSNLRHSLSSSEALSRLSRVSSSVSSKICNTLKSYRSRAALKAITRKECFAKLECIKKLSIRDMIVLFRYANDVNQAEFLKKQFMREQSQLVRSIVAAMDMAVTMSRGAKRQSVITKNDGRKGDIDALYFAAVTRIFAEWRTLRLVPGGYGRYAAGLSMAYRDVLQNLAKIEAGVHVYLKHFVGTTQGGYSLCPTLREIIEFERHTNVHPRLPYLTEKSAASGLLWTKRQLEYQTTIFFNILQVPVDFTTTQSAASAAYTQVFGEYHGWALKQLFGQSFGGSPPLEAILKHMDPGIREESSNKPFGLNSSRRLTEMPQEGEELDNEFLAAMEGFGKFVGKKWDDVLHFFNCVDRKNLGNSSQNVFVSRESYLDMNNLHTGVPLGTLSESVSDDSDQSAIACDPYEETKQDILQFVNDLRPLLEDISGLLEENNMNDPTRV
jgi:Glycolipid transfer protein (GLTP)